MRSIDRPRLAGATLFAIAAIAAIAPASALAQGSPTCSALGIANHGHHIIGDYVTGAGAIFAPNEQSWPPSGEVGAVIRENGGPVLPGGAAAHGHFNVPGLAPGASFCLEQAHPNGFETPQTGR
jgi:hypothetical protein